MSVTLRKKSCSCSVMHHEGRELVLTCCIKSCKMQALNFIALVTFLFISSAAATKCELMECTRDQIVLETIGNISKDQLQGADQADEGRIGKPKYLEEEGCVILCAQEFPLYLGTCEGNTMISGKST